MSVTLIGLSGTNGAGKDAVAEMLAKERGFLFVGATEMLVKELERLGRTTSREDKSTLSAEWRREFGMGVIVDKALAEFEKVKDQYKGLVVSSLRHPAEADRVHDAGGEVWWIDADPEVRYDRIRSANRGRPLEDDKTFEEFLAEEQREMHRTGDEATLNTAAVKERADRILYNNGNSLDGLKTLVAENLIT
ncbi:MAG TPA: AAA family ATPase [Candidatus Saccharimonadales bacterium]|jgi:dephospho-CoA kinase|nr:AAA family ATPase [Candidatus Saccharimonadales bacterium]